jgi:drug/metabolite transporter (DMT)-like permease
MSKPEDAPAVDPRRTKGLVALLGVQFAFGLFPVIGKWALEGFSPRSVSGWRILWGAVAFTLLGLALYRKRFWPPRGDWARLVACAYLGVAVNMTLFLEGLQRSTATNAGFLVPLIPVFTFAVALLVRQERFQPLRALGIAIALGGTLLLALEERPELGGAYVTGNLLMVANCFCYAVYLVIVRPLLARHPPIVVLAWLFLLSVPALPWLLGGGRAIPPDVTTRAWASLGFVLLFPTFLSYLLNTYALSILSSSTTAVFIYLQSFITAFGAWMLLEDRITPRLFVAALIVMVGTGLVVVRPVRRGAARPAPVRS